MMDPDRYIADQEQFFGHAKADDPSRVRLSVLDEFVKHAAESQWFGSSETRGVWQFSRRLRTRHAGDIHQYIDVHMSPHVTISRRESRTGAVQLILAKPVFDRLQPENPWQEAIISLQTSLSGLSNGDGEVFDASSFRSHSATVTIGKDVYGGAVKIADEVPSDRTRPERVWFSVPSKDTLVAGEMPMTEWLFIRRGGGKEKLDIGEGPDATDPHDRIHDIFGFILQGMTTVRLASSVRNFIDAQLGNTGHPVHPMLSKDAEK